MLQPLENLNDLTQISVSALVEFGSGVSHRTRHIRNKKAPKRYASGLL
jgi:hypothetical protein